jgi:hypothetical protein
VKLFARVVRRLDRRIPINHDGLGDLALLAPHELAKAIANPADRITDVRVLGWVEQIGETDQADEVEVKPRQSVSKP